MSKSKGSAAERELVHMFWKVGWACIRVAGSGSIKYPSPDIIAGNSIRKIVMECKSTKNVRQYLTAKEVDELIEFSKVFGAEAWFGVRFDRRCWCFITPDDLVKTKTKGNYVVSYKKGKEFGLDFDELIS